MTQEDIAGLAKSLIEEISVDLQDASQVAFTKEGDALILIATAGDSVLHFNPQKWAEKIIDQQQRLGSISQPKWSHERVVRESKADICNMLLAITHFMGDALWILSKLSSGMAVEFNLGAFYKHVQAGVRVSTFHVIEERLRELLRLPERSLEAHIEDYKAAGAHLQKRDYAINGSQILDALRKLDRFSIRGLARLLAPEREDFRPTIYDWMERRQVTRDDLEQKWREFHSKV